MSASIETPIKTPQSSKHLATENLLSTPLFVPPTPMLKELGYGTGTSFFLQRLNEKNRICIEKKSIFLFDFENKFRGLFR